MTASGQVGAPGAMPAQGGAPATEDRLELVVGAHGCIDRAVGHAGRNGHAAHLAADAADEGGRVGCVGGGEVRNLRGNDVVEDAEAEMDHGAAGALRRPLRRAAARPAAALTETGCCTLVSNGLVERLVDVVRKIEKRSSGPREQALLIHGIGVPGGAHAGDEGGLGGGLVGIHRVEVKIAGGDALFERDGKCLCSRCRPRRT